LCASCLCARQEALADKKARLSCYSALGAYHHDLGGLGQALVNRVGDELGGRLALWATLKYSGGALQARVEFQRSDVAAATRLSTRVACYWQAQQCRL